MLLNSKLFIVSGSPCILMLGGCDPTAVLEIYIVLVVYAASQQTLLTVSGSPSNPMLGGGDLNAMLGVIVVLLGVNAAYFQSLHETT